RHPSPEHRTPTSPQPNYGAQRGHHGWVVPWNTWILPSTPWPLRLSSDHYSSPTRHRPSRSFPVSVYTARASSFDLLEATFSVVSATNTDAASFSLSRS